MTRQRPVVLTVGHSNVELADFLTLLAGAKVEALADVRSDPDRVYREHFASAPLRSALTRVGISYVFLGEGLGGRPRRAEHHDADGRARYDQMAQEPAFVEALRRVETGARTRRIALLCSEENPLECHRRLLVGRALVDRGVEVRHLRADGSLVDERELAVADGQEGLFDDLEVRPWRSARSVPRSGAPSPSSEP
jgi:uncharacterized protein (DUF488 family)